jgi:RNA polymerase sigma-70 factor (ECF subfamily)
MGEASDEELIRRAVGGDDAALATLFDRHRGRLERMVGVRLDPRLRGRVDPADVLQEAYLDAARQLPSYPGVEAMPPFLWLRLVTGRRLGRVRRDHLGAARRAAGREVRLDPGGAADSACLAAGLADSLTTASRALDRQERRALVQKAVESLDAADREIIALRGFEGLSQAESAAVLGTSVAAASKRYVRALARLQAALEATPGLLERPDAG